MAFPGSLFPAWVMIAACVVAPHTGRRAWLRKKGESMRSGFGAFCILVAIVLPAVAASEPGWKLAGTYPDTGGRAPVAHGGKVLPPGSSPASVLAACSGDIDRICA